MIINWCSTNTNGDVTNNMKVSKKIAPIVIGTISGNVTLTLVGKVMMKCMLFVVLLLKIMHQLITMPTNVDTV